MQKRRRRKHRKQSAPFEIWPEAACRGGAAPVVSLLLGLSPFDARGVARSARSPPLDRADVAGWTPLHVAARMGRAQVVVLLLKAFHPETNRFTTDM